jgi:hypothetical protein
VHERPPQRTRLRTAAPALRSPSELGTHHHDDPRVTRKSPRTDAGRRNASPPTADLGPSRHPAHISIPQARWRCRRSA